MVATPRVVSLAPSVTAILTAAGLDTHVVGVTAHSPTGKSVVGDWLNPDLDQIGDPDADAVCICGDLQSGVTTVARDRGYDVARTAPAMPDEILGSFLVVCGTAGDAGARVILVDDCRDHLARVTDTVAGHGRLATYCRERVDPSMAAGNWVPDLICVAGGIAPPVASGERSAEVDPETVVAANPDYVTLHPCGKGERSDPEAFGARGWNLDVAVHTVNDSLLNQPNPAVILGIDRPARLPYPDTDLPEPWATASETAAATPAGSDKGK